MSDDSFPAVTKSGKGPVHAPDARAGRFGRIPAITGSARVDQSGDDPLWYMDAVIYEVHIKSFFDANDDGIGDFRGLIQKLDYLRQLGVTAIWVLPFYPSPLRDDGYDIAEYRSINPSYGTMRDFRAFVRTAHQMGLRVITELVINHTSDQHPWFQRARNAPKGSKARDWYIWSDDDKRWPETRIIFSDTETSNWTWDPVAKQYYWHRFFSHQPDLNFDNPQVFKAIINAMRFWLDTGVDGLRLDAIPYLVERDGTSNENIPETHKVIKQLRAALDESHPHAFFLAEANQWPEDTLPYFGDGDECHMAFHFPLMPRMYMAMAQEDRHPITDIMRQTPEIPQNCQWAIFLRNHDELTLEMVTDRERDYLWQVYAADKRARINFGIRRRLAPLMENDRRKIELLNSLLFSMPGTPIIYYGDEIGMGDNVYLGDRDGVRTPMQWSPDRNGGFSRTDPAKLYLPPIMDPIYGYDAVNVEAQSRSSSSLLNWMRRIIAVRQQHMAFGRGSMSFLYPSNRKILAYLRQHQDDVVLCVANLSRRAQAVELELGAFRGRTPVELMGRSAFPPIGDLPYQLTLPAYSFYWFVLTLESKWHEPLPELAPDYRTLVLREGPGEMLEGRAHQELVTGVLPGYLATQRWFAAKQRRIQSIAVHDGIEVPWRDGRVMAALADATLEDGTQQRYFLPLSLVWDESRLAAGAGTAGSPIAKIRQGPRVGVITDASVESGFVHRLVDAIRNGDALAGRHGRLLFHAGRLLADFPPSPDEPVRRMGVEQSNTSLVIGDRMVMKLLRQVQTGPHPEVEIGRVLTDICGFDRVPPFLGMVEYIDGEGQGTALALLQGFIRNQGDGWTYTQEYLQREMDELRTVVMESDDPGAPEDRFAVYLQIAVTLGRRTAELHRALHDAGDQPGFKPEPFGPTDRDDLAQRILSEAESAMTLLSSTSTPDGGVLVARAAELEDRIRTLARSAVGGARIRHHGDLHLGQILIDRGDILFVDFEGEPARPLADRRTIQSPLRDVAGMIRSFDYAAWSVLMQMEDEIPGSVEGLLDQAVAWRDLTVEAFLTSYTDTLQGSGCLPEDTQATQSLLDLFLLEKAVYEINYEAANRPAWLRIPVQGVMSLLDKVNED